MEKQHLPCTDCGSSDALTVYPTGWSHCFACGKNRKHKGEPIEEKPKKRMPLLTDLNTIALTKRGLTEETCKEWGYHVSEFSGRPCHVAVYRDADGEVVGQKIRTPDKDFLIAGKNISELLFGRHKWKSGGKMVVLTEGEIDAMTVSQLQDHKWPVASVPTGAKGAEKAIRANIEWLSSFEKVIFLFDMDAEGRKAASECAILLPPGKAFIGQLPLKDANDCLRAGKAKDVISAIWNARPYRPDGVVNGSELGDAIKNRKAFESTPYPWAKLNSMTRGMRRGELVLLCAGSGVGKSEVARQIMWFQVSQLPPEEKIGCIFLEESLQRSALGFLGLHLGRKLHIDLDTISDVELDEAKAAVFDSGRFYFYDHFGSNESENLLAKIRYMVVGLGCTTIVLDHISIVVSGLEIDDERKALDVLATKLKTMLQELNFRMLGVIHLKRTDGKTFEEGGHISLNDIRGSGGPGQLANIVIGLERDQQNEEQKHYTRIRVVKNRHTGETGVAGWLKYGMDGRLTEEDPPDEQSEQRPSTTTTGDEPFA